MNKKLSTVLFVLGGTVLNLILMLTFISGLIYAANKILTAFVTETNQTIEMFAYSGAILGGLVLAFIVYSRIMKMIQNKFELEKYLEPLFKSKRRY